MTSMAISILVNNNMRKACLYKYYDMLIKKQLLVVYQLDIATIAC